MDKAYINRKLENCRKLIDTATSEAQKAVYQGYLEFWQKKSANNQYEPEGDDKELAEFKLKFPNKKAYYNRNGKTFITKAYKEFLISKE